MSSQSAVQRRRARRDQKRRNASSPGRSSSPTHGLLAYSAIALALNAAPAPLSATAPTLPLAPIAPVHIIEQVPLLLESTSNTRSMRSSYYLSMSTDQQARLAALESVLLRDLCIPEIVPDGDSLALMRAKLPCIVYQTNAETALMTYVLGKAYMRSLSGQLSRLNRVEPSDENPGIEPFALYVQDETGWYPTPEGIEAWSAMRHRLIRKLSELSQRLDCFVGEAPFPRQQRAKTLA